MLTVQDINLTMTFLQRVQLQGNEAAAYVQLIHKLGQEGQRLQQPPETVETANSEGASKKIEKPSVS